LTYNKAKIDNYKRTTNLEWRAGLSDTVLEGYHQRTILAKFGFIWFRCFREEYLNLKDYLQHTENRRMTNDGH